MNPGLELCNLQCCRGDRLLFDSLDVQTLPGQMLKVSGPNGAGKTSLLRISAVLGGTCSVFQDPQRF